MKVYIYCIFNSCYFCFAIFKKSKQFYWDLSLFYCNFTLLLEKEIIKDIVLFCGGDS
ncbi:MAG: hypothetical protein QMO91_00875 [Candidatus Tisiphia sp.]|nr:hypothetical protein [Candidatus Tisiphia sp.]